MEHAIPVSLEHFRVRVEARVAQVCDLFREQFDAVRRVAEDDGLVDLEFGEERVEAVDFLTLFHIGVVLSYAAKGQFVHKVDFIGVLHVAVLRQSAWIPKA